MNLRYRVDLDQPERDELSDAGRRQAAGASSSGRISCSPSTRAWVTRSLPRRWWSAASLSTKRRFVEMGQEAALSEEPRAGAQRKLTGKEEALLVATA